MKRFNTIISFIVFLLVWETLVGFRIVNTLFLPPPSTLLRTFIKNWDYLTLNTLITLRHASLGYLIGVSIGVILGIITGWYKSLDASLGSLVNTFYNVPKFTFLPLFIIWLGLSEYPIILVSTLSAFFPTYMNTNSGVKKIDKSFIEAVKNIGANDKDTLLKVVFPGSMPHITSGMRLSIRMALIGSTTSEMLISHSGLGAVIWQSGALLRIDMMLLGPAILGLIGFLLFKAFNCVEKKFLPWINMT